ncbi:MAG: heme lyase CcmF/NrfE family subunit [Candidatus Tectomicrobia bacterium]|uniref:Heme lyase CcmF/NrfE family subunit n=1 Tax=Tectimicrobiota bacterium TaxID=2528274 RepID=A0A932I4L7_UNCTE|nr:heme lyase CcmF/NrfE family subunit [Candidatus Tectomicrobia bacterium]
MLFIELGSYGITAAFVLAIFSVIASVWGGLSRRADFILAGRNAAMAVFGLVTAASIALLWLLLARDYRVEYVAGHVDNQLNAFYRFSAFWGGQEGSLLLWVLLLCIFSFTVIVQNRGRNQVLMPYVTATLMVTALFFLTILAFITPPFATLPTPPPDGKGLNPLLQDWGMVIHPPNLYLGFVGFAVPFAFCIGALVSGKLDTDWITSTRRWTLFAWFFLGIGILLGGAWAYKELGWGGYWAWDPVENASLMPWLTGTAFLHSVMIQEKRGMLKVWNVSLIIMTYALTIFGTFLTRSGIISSVHAFASSSFGWAFLAYLAIALAVSFGLVIWRLPLLRSEHEMESFFSREASFLLNNVVLVGMTFAVFWGTIFPVVSEAVKGIKVTVGPPFFNQVNVPIAILLIFLAGASPLLAWRRTSGKQFQKSFVYPSVVAAGGLATLLLFGVTHVFAVLAIALSIFSVATIWLEYYRGVSARVRHQGENAWTAFWELTMRNKRRFGGYIVHLGMAILFIGIAASSAYQQVGEVRLRPGESFSMNGIRLRFEGLRETRNSQYTSAFAKLAVYQGGRRMGEIEPEKRLYFTPPQPTTEAGIRRGFASDIYAVFAEAGEDGATFRFMINPLLNWVWMGGIIFTLGSLICFFPERWGRRRRALPSAYGSEGDYRAPDKSPTPAAAE